MIFTRNDKALCVQSCINCYEGRHGEINWDRFDKDSVEYFNIDNHKEGYTAIYNHPELGKTLFIVHEGSGDEDDWKHNYDAKLVRGIKKKTEKNAELTIPFNMNTSKVRIHKGFLHYYYNIQKHMREKAKWAYDNGYSIITTGHSLGGAIATLTFIDLQYYFNDELGIEPQFLYGYAASSPRVGNKHFKKSFENRDMGHFYNEWYGNDTVHAVPTIWMGYSHVRFKKRWASVWTNIQAGIVEPLSLFGLIPKISFWDHDPRKLLAAIKGEKVPFADKNTND